ncbi:uncharacterized protein EAF01_001825 [Botrytis porri]|uniref:uncharacterized protein n=1 Tax=Botrytis porri TaxID=87229 RepID=UPI001901FB8F|nr:uncharacterized protein EAF01_001825 [Botrytis porri]KAF7912804.1 hypothetical protein EAF01_001825 [Botrytis porri]
MPSVTRTASGKIPARTVLAPVEPPKQKKAAPKANTGKKVAAPTKGSKPTGIGAKPAQKKKPTVAAKSKPVVEKIEEAAEKAADTVEEKVDEATAEKPAVEKPAPKKKATPAPKKPVTKKPVSKKPAVKA